MGPQYGSIVELYYYVQAELQCVRGFIPCPAQSGFWFPIPILLSRGPLFWGVPSPILKKMYKWYINRLMISMFVYSYIFLRLNKGELGVKMVNKFLFFN